MTNPNTPPEPEQESVDLYRCALGSMCGFDGEGLHIREDLSNWRPGKVVWDSEYSAGWYCDSCAREYDDLPEPVRRPDHYHLVAPGLDRPYQRVDLGIFTTKKAARNTARQILAIRRPTLAPRRERLKDYAIKAPHEWCEGDCLTRKAH